MSMVLALKISYPKTVYYLEETMSADNLLLFLIFENNVKNLKT
jgi:hypothetical protein